MPKVILRSTSEKPAGPISPKVSNGTLLGIVDGIVAAALVFYVPAWHHGLPPFVSQLIPVSVGAASYFVGGFVSKHHVTFVELERVVADHRLRQKLFDTVLAGTMSVALPKSSSSMQFTEALSYTNSPNLRTRVATTSAQGFVDAASDKPPADVDLSGSMSVEEADVSSKSELRPDDSVAESSDAPGTPIPAASTGDVF